MKRVLVLRHGIVLNRYFMLPMQRYFHARGWIVDNRSYRTTRKRVEEHAEDLAAQLVELHETMENAGEAHEIYCITHSMAGLVLRYALTHFPMPPIRRAVLMVPPNQGSVTARYFKRFGPYRWLYGPHSGAQLAEDPPGIFAQCGVPEGVELGVIAGDVRRKMWGSPLERPHDGVVAVSEAELPPFPLKRLPYGHTPILWVRYAWEEAEHFLQTGEFRVDDDRRPEPENAPAPS